jgi:hypothetical protein
MRTYRAISGSGLPKRSGKISFKLSGCFDLLDLPAETSSVVPGGCEGEEVALIGGCSESSFDGRTGGDVSLSSSMTGDEDRALSWFSIVLDCIRSGS